MAKTETNFRLGVRRIMFRLPAGAIVSSPKLPDRLLSTQASYSVGKGGGLFLTDVCVWRGCGEVGG